ncbi:immunoglobulin superfamily DCC subclass member 3-like isoform X3 [Symphalangus syndactylus]
MSSRGVTTRLSLEPGNTVAVQEHPLVLPCQVEGEPPVSISWQQDRLALANDSGATLMPDGSLHLAALPSHWSLPSCAHEYHCMAQNSYGRLVSRRARVQLASLSRFHQHPESAEVEQGGVARFQCLIQGVPEPSISWEHNGTALNIASHRVTLLPSSILHIASVSQADMGTYRCMAWNVASTRHSQDAQLTLSVGPPRLLQEPEILSGPQNLTLTVHQTAMLECIATGHPQPLVSWSCLDGRSISVEGIQVLGTGNLMISDVSVQHSDVYVCAANQPGSRVRRTAQGVLLMQAPPEFVQWPQSLSKPPGSSAIFTCVAQGIPEPCLVWLKNGKVLSPGDNIRLTHNNSTLMLAGVSVEDEAIYQCVAENSVGSNQASARLAVTGGREPPHPQAPACHGSLYFCHSSVLGAAPLQWGHHWLRAAPLACGRPPGSCHPSWGPSKASNSFTASCLLPILRGLCSWPAVSAPSSTQTWNRLPSMRSSCRRSMAMGMEIAVPALSHCVMCPWPLLMAQCPQSPRLGALAARVRAAHCLGLWWVSTWAWLPSSFASSASSWAGDIASSANRSPRNAGQCLRLPRTELGAVKARLRVEGSWGRRLNSPPR